MDEHGLPSPEVASPRANRDIKGTAMSDETPDWKLQFLSDNASPICPEAWEGLEQANSRPNSTYTVAYGDDPITAEATRLIQEIFETDCEVFFVFNGSAANSLALASICQSYHGILCHPLSHAESDEANAPEFFTGGAKLLHVDGANGKMNPQGIPKILRRGHGIHSAKIRGVTITQATEVGTVYTMEEIYQLTAMKHDYAELDFKFHMDGARFANAVVALDHVAPKEITWQAGIDVLTFGGTKNGCPGTEALVFFDKTLARDFAWRRKQAGQLASKMRYLAAPWIGILKNETWLNNARHANDHARLLGNELAAVAGVTLPFDIETNAVFARLPDGLAKALHAHGWHFYHFADADAWRFMCTWNTTKEAIQALIGDVREFLPG